MTKKLRFCTVHHYSGNCCLLFFRSKDDNSSEVAASEACTSVHSQQAAGCSQSESSQPAEAVSNNLEQEQPCEGQSSTPLSTLPVESPSSADLGQQQSDASQQSLVDISATYHAGPTQPKLSVYPKTYFGSQDRSFNSTWYLRHPLIEYSVDLDAVFCFVCRHFTPSSGYTDLTLVTNGCRNWKKLGTKLNKHCESSSHREAVARWTAAKQSDAAGNILNRVDNQFHQEVIRNRQAVSTMIRAVVFCARQSIALRGHRESQDGEVEGSEYGNPGNFLELLSLLEISSPDIASQLRALPRNAQYTSKESQDGFIQSAAKVIQQQIVQEIKQSGGVFSIIVDEARDNSCREQMSICVRYLSTVERQVKERFLGVTSLKDMSAASLASAIKEFLAGVGLSLHSCIAQSYDGASVMSGVNNGVQAIIRKESDNPCPYVHCHAHRLNLVLVDLAKQVDFVGDTFGLLEAIYAFQSVSPLRHQVFLNKQTEEERVLSITQQSDTRWVCKIAGVKYFYSRLKCVVAALSELAASRNKKEAAEARGFLLQIRSFDVILSLTLLHDLLPVTHTLSTQLQSSSLDFGTSRRLVDSCTTTLRQKRSDVYVDHIWKETCQKANEVGVPTPSDSEPVDRGLVSKRVSRPSQRLASSIIYSTTGTRTVQTSTELDQQTLYRRKVFAVVDAIIREMDRRFTTNDDLLAAVAACDPQSCTFLSEESILKVAESYKKLKVCDIYCIQRRLLQWVASCISNLLCTVPYQLLCL